MLPLAIDSLAGKAPKNVDPEGNTMTIHTDPITALTETTNRNYDSELLARVAWACISEPADEARGRLIAEHGPENALRLILSDQSLDTDGAALRERIAGRFAPEQIAEVIRCTEDIGATILTPGHLDWPTQLSDLAETAPVCLWVRGDTTLLGQRGVAMIGARACTGYGEHVTIDLAMGLVEHGWVIVSGAAYGIDGVAHRAALAADGNTIAVLAGGVDRFYPAGHDTLLQRIAAAGAVVSEIPVMAPPTKWRFLARNRIIAALAEKTIVVEAGHRSGALNTAMHAVALGRPVGAVPGPVTSVTSAGCHRLIREHHATLITTTDDAHAL